MTFELAIDGAERVAALGDEPGVTLVDAAGRAWRLADLRAWDADGKALPVSLDVDGAVVRVSVDDTGARYPLTVDPTLSNTWSQ